MKNILPQNYRGITAHTTKRFREFQKHHLIVLVIFETAVLLGLSCFLILTILQYKHVRQERLTELKSLAAWEKLITKYPKYPEVYYGAAVHARRVGDSDKALEYVNKTLQLNPNFEPGKKLLRELTH